MKTEQLFMAAMAYYAGEPRQIQHFIKVHSFSKRIGIGEKLDSHSLFVLETAAIVHDIGIKQAVSVHGSGSGRFQEMEGPPIAEALLNKLDYPKAVVERVCFLVGHHHTYDEIDGPDYQILVEADFLVNMFEGGMDKAAIQSIWHKIFRTKTGKEIGRLMFQIDR